jgi:hypothetical protein
MSDNLTLFFIMTGFVAFLIGLSKGGLGGTPGALATPLMMLVMPAKQVIGLLLPILMFADIFAVAVHWKRWDRRLVILLIPGAIVGVTLATYFIKNAPTRTIQAALGVIVLAFVLYILFEKRIFRAMHYQSHNWHGLVAGTVAGFSSGLAHTGGPPVSIYLLMQNISPSVFNATAALFFMILNWIKVPYYYYAGLFNWHRLFQVVWLLPLVPLGVWVGKRMSDRINKQVFDLVITILLAVAGLLLILGL